MSICKAATNCQRYKKIFVLFDELFDLESLSDEILQFLVNLLFFVQFFGNSNFCGDSNFCGESIFFGDFLGGAAPIFVATTIFSFSLNYLLLSLIIVY